MQCNNNVSSWTLIPYPNCDTSSSESDNTTDSDSGSENEQKGVWRGWRNVSYYKTHSDFDLGIPYLTIIPKRDGIAQKAISNPIYKTPKSKKFKGVKLTGGSGRLPDQVYSSLRSEKKE